MRKVGLIGLALIVCGWPLSGYGQAEPNDQESSSQRRKQAGSSRAQDNTEGGVNENPRQRRRVLDKRNPLASEYQGLGDIGFIALADQDSEGIDSRSRIHKEGLFDVKGRRIESEVSYHYSEQSGRGAWQGSLSYQRILGKKDNWAILLQGERTGAHQLYEEGNFRWRPHQTDDETGYLLERFVLRYYSLSTAINKYAFLLEHRRDGGHRFYFHAQVEDREGSDSSRNLQNHIGAGEVIKLEPTTASVRNASADRTIWDSRERRDRTRFLIGGEFESAHSRFDYSYYFSKWKRTRTGTINPIFRREGVDYTYSTENPAFPILSIDNGVNLDDASMFDFVESTDRDSETEDHDHVVEVNYERWGTVGDSMLDLKLGGVFRSKERTNADTRSVWNGYHGPFNLANVVGEEVGRIVQDRYSFGPDIDPESFRRFFARNSDRFELAEGRTRIETEPNNYGAQEDVGGLYLLQRFERNRLAIKGGLRLEFARTQTDGKEVITDENGDYLRSSPVQQKDDYARLLPTVEVEYTWNANLRLGLAWFNTLARPDYFVLVPYRRVFTNYRYISEGNPALVPTELGNLVAVLDVKSEFTGELTVSLYHKGIDRFFYDSEKIIDGGELDGWIMRRTENGESGSVWGFEFAWDKELNVLPGGWGALTASGFYTFSESEAEVETRPGEHLLIPERSRHLASFSLRHDLGDWRSELAIKYQSRYLDDIGADPAQDEYVDEALRLDARFEYRWSPIVSLFAKFYNLGDTPKRQYEGSPLRRAEAEYGSWRVLVGCRFSL